DADHDAGAVDALGAKDVRPTRRVALRRDATRTYDRAVDPPDRTHPREPGERVERLRIDTRLHETARHLRSLDAHARLLELLELARPERRAIGVHRQAPTGRERGPRGDEPAGRRSRSARRQELGLDLRVRSACPPQLANGGDDVIERALR